MVSRDRNKQCKGHIAEKRFDQSDCEPVIQSEICWDEHCLSSNTCWTQKYHFYDVVHTTGTGNEITLILVKNPDSVWKGMFVM